MKISAQLNSVYANELADVIRAFFPDAELSPDGEVLYFREVFGNDSYAFTVSLGEKTSGGEIGCKVSDRLEYKRVTKRAAKIALYEFLSDVTGKKLPYGSLTGIRPTKLFRELCERGEDAEKVFLTDFGVSAEKTALVKRITEVQKDSYLKDAQTVDFFVNIPFCPTRCTYCSFITVPVSKLKKYINEYVFKLKEEISILKNIIKENNYRVRAVYFGGGTPTSLPINLLAELLGQIDFPFDEFTVEAGRPDTVNADVLRLLADGGVTRISVNPQTLNDKTLQIIGRQHTAARFFEAYSLAARFDFDVNVDLIAALPGENFGDFKYSLDSVRALKPQNVTVHTLSLKRGSSLMLSDYDNTSDEAAAMVDYAYRALTGVGYEPYYMYRQKHQSGNLENTGYALPGKPSLYNIDIMEESLSVLAAGAGSISKRLFAENGRLERQADFKSVIDYIARFDEIKNLTRKFWA